MLLKMTANDNTNAFQGYATMKLDFSQSRWSIEQDPRNVWSKVSSNVKGNFESKNWGVIWVKDPMNKDRILAIIQHAPKNADDSAKPNGVARIYQPDNAAFRDAYFKWQIDTTTPTAPVAPSVKPLKAIRKRVVDLACSILTPKGKLFTHGPKPPKDSKQKQQWDPALAKIMYELIEDRPSSGYTSCGALAAWVGLQLGRKQFLTIQRLMDMKKTNAPGWVHATGKNLPLPGDVYVLLQPNGDFSHTGMVVSATSTVWETADTGQGKGFSGGRKDRAYTAATNMLAGEILQGGDDRTVAGWVNINTKGLFKDGDGID